MELLFFSGLHPAGHYQECTYGGPDVASCFDVLNQLTRDGWQLRGAKLLESGRRTKLELPVDAFTGEAMSPELERLQQTWEGLLKDELRLKKRAIAVSMEQAASKLRQVEEQREQSGQRIAKLLERIEETQRRIQTTKSEWGLE